jgi:hypothetical protein
MPEPTGPFLRSLQAASEQRDRRHRGELRVEPITPEMVAGLAEQRDEWEPIGYVSRGSAGLARAGTPAPDIHGWTAPAAGRRRTFVVWPNPFLPSVGPAHREPLRTSILRDAISAIATITRSVLR